MLREPCTLLVGQNHVSTYNTATNGVVSESAPSLTTISTVCPWDLDFRMISTFIARMSQRA